MYCKSLATRPAAAKEQKENINNNIILRTRKLVCGCLECERMKRLRIPPASHTAASCGSTRNRHLRLRPTDTQKETERRFNILLYERRDQQKYRLTWKTKKRADITKLQAVPERLDGSIYGRKNHYQVADSVPCSNRRKQVSGSDFRLKHLQLLLLLSCYF